MGLEGPESSGVFPMGNQLQDQIPGGWAMLPHPVTPRCPGTPDPSLVRGGSEGWPCPLCQQDTR